VAVYYIRNDMVSLTDFYCKVPEGGFTWVHHAITKTNRPGRYLTFGAPSRVRSVSPLSETGLFRRFADLAPTEEAIQRFASSFGFLRSFADAESLLIQTPSGETKPGKGELFETWFEEIQDMKAMVRLWDATKAGDMAVLSDFIEWTEVDSGDRGFVYYRRQPFSSFKAYEIASKERDPEHYASFQTWDLVQPALFALQRLVNEKLRTHGGVPKLLWTNGKHPALKMRLAPNTLIAVLWLQFAYGIEGDRVYRQCEMCGKWFEVATTLREDAKFCQNACRSKSYRGRQKEARELHAQGMTVAAIAKQLGSDVKTVKGWVKS